MPELTAWATFDRTAIAAGQLWRLITGHWTHWSGEHLGWDLLVFAVAGGVLELRGKRNAFLTCTVLSALLISGGVWVLRPEMVECRGLSGIDCALVTLVAVDLLRQSLRERRWSLSLGLAGLLAGYLGKVVFELATGQTLFVASGQGLFVPVPLAHVLGGGLGIALGLMTPSGPATQGLASCAPTRRARSELPGQLDRLPRPHRLLGQGVRLVVLAGDDVPGDDGVEVAAEVVAQLVAQPLAAGEADQLAPKHLLGREEKPPLALERLGGEALHRRGREEGLVEGDDAGESA
jgi:rhomboid family GlyGly-CTERM serine protease